MAHIIRQAQVGSHNSKEYIDFHHCRPHISQTRSDFKLKQYLDYTSYSPSLISHSNTGVNILIT